MPIDPDIARNVDFLDQEGATRGRRRSLMQLLPPLEPVSGSFASLATDSADPDVPAGSVAAYPLIQLVPGDVFDQDVSLFAVQLELMSPASAGAAAGVWGGDNGTNAAIVVGRGLVLPDGWSALPASLAGMGDDLTQTDRKFDVVRRFPPGTWTDQVPVKDAPFIPFGAFGRRVKRGQMIGAALVIDRDEYNTAKASSASIVGFGAVTVYLGLSRGGKGFG